MPRPSRVARPLAAVVTLLVVLVSAACSADSPTTSGSAQTVDSRPTAAQLSAVTLRVGDQIHLLQALLTASGQDQHLPYHLQFDQFSSGPPLVQALVAGAIDIGGVGDTPPLFSAAAGSGIRIVAAESSGGDRAEAIVVPKGSSLHHLSDLKGKKVAFAQASAAQYTLLALLRRSGLSFSDITPVNLQPAQALAALASGSIDAWAVWYPFVAIAEANGARVLASGASVAAGDGFEVTTTPVLADAAKAAAIGDLLTRLAQANRWLAGHLSEWVPTYSSLTGMSDAVARQTVIYDEAHFVPLDQSVIAEEQVIADAFSDQGLIPRIHVGDFVDARYNRLLCPSPAC